MQEQTNNTEASETSQAGQPEPDSRDSLREELDKWRGRVPKLASALRQRTEEAESLKAELEGLRRVSASGSGRSDAGVRARDELISELEAKLETLDGRYKTAEGELHARNLEVSDLKEDLRLWKDKWQSVTQSLDVEAEAAESRQDQVQTLNQTLTKVRQELAEQQAALRRCELDLADAREERESLLGRNEKLFETTEMANQQIESLADSLADMRQELRESGDREAAALARTEALQRELQAEKEALEQQEEALRLKTEELRLKTEELRLEKEELQSEKDALQREAETRQQESEALRREGEEQRREIEAERRATEEARGETERLRVESEQLRQEAEARRLETEALQRETEARGLEFEALRRELEGLHRSEEALQGEREAQIAAADQLAEELRQELQKSDEAVQIALAAALDSARDAQRNDEQFTESAAAAAAALAQAAESESVIAEQRAEIARLEGCIDGAEESNSAREQERRELSEKLAALENRNERLEQQIAERSALVVELEENQSRHDEQMRQVEREKQELDDARLRADRQAQENAQHITQLDDRLERQKALMEDLEKELAEAHEASASAQASSDVQTAADSNDTAALDEKIRRLERLVREQAEELNRERWERQVIQKEDADNSNGKMMLVLNQQLNDARGQNASLLDRVRDLEEELTHIRMQHGGDDLTRIHGIGHRLAEQLNEVGIYRLEQIAELDELALSDECHALYAHKGRILRDGWIDQAARLVSH